jgi:hypothetical protein
MIDRKFVSETLFCLLPPFYWPIDPIDVWARLSPTAPALSELKNPIATGGTHWLTSREQHPPPPPLSLTVTVSRRSPIPGEPATGTVVPATVYSSLIARLQITKKQLCTVLVLLFNSFLAIYRTSNPLQYLTTLDHDQQ